MAARCALLALVVAALWTISGVIALLPTGLFRFIIGVFAFGATALVVVAPLFTFTLLLRKHIGLSAAFLGVPLLLVALAASRTFSVVWIASSLLLSFAISAAALRLFTRDDPDWRGEELCPRCAYDIRESDNRCPECGATTLRRSAVRSRSLIAYCLGNRRAVLFGTVGLATLILCACSGLNRAYTVEEIEDAIARGDLLRTPHEDVVAKLGLSPLPMDPGLYELRELVPDSESVVIEIRTDERANVTAIRVLKL